MNSQFKLLIVGSGGRECAIAKKIWFDNSELNIFYCNNEANPILDNYAEFIQCEHIGNTNEIVMLVKMFNITNVIVGPELPLKEGLVDALNDIGINTVGPTKDLAQIETSKTFARELITEANLSHFLLCMILLNLAINLISNY